MIDYLPSNYEKATQPFEEVYSQLRSLLMKHAPKVDVGEWHAMNIKGKPDLVSRELRAVTFHVDMPQGMIHAQEQYKPNLPWAEDQFQERVSGQPLNPGNTYHYWPWQNKMSNHLDEGVFSHTYMERYWPQYANDAGRDIEEGGPRHGIRYRYGDLRDVVDLLARSPYTRQAVLPVWFPEDTGAVHGGRLPCSLYYHFLLRGDSLQCEYSIRSCDFVRHFRDDVYMTVRLAQWVLTELRKIHHKWEGITIGTFTMHIGSLHIFEGDFPTLNKEIEEEVKRYGQSS